MQMQKEFAEEGYYNFCPETFMLPFGMAEFRNQFKPPPPAEPQPGDEPNNEAPATNTDKKKNHDKHGDADGPPRKKRKDKVLANKNKEGNNAH